MATQAEYFAALKAQLQADAGLVAWADEHFGTTWKFFDGAASAPIESWRSGVDDVPGIVIEPDDGTSEAVILARPRRRLTVPMTVTFAWREVDAAKVIEQRLKLPELVIAALIADHTLGGVVTFADVDVTASWLWDTTERPLVLMQTRVIGEFDRTFTAGS